MRHSSKSQKTGLAITLFLFCCLARAQDISLSFKHLTINNGLSQNSALCIHQDHLNRVWIGTREGLNCYNGEQIAIFKPILGNNESLLDFKINKLAQIGHYLVALGYGGVSILNLNNLKVKRVAFSGCNSIHVFKNQLFLGTESSGLFIMDTVLFIPKKVTNALDHVRISTLCGENELIIGTKENGVMIYDLTDDSIFMLAATRQMVNITTVLKEEGGRVIIGTEFDGMYILDSSGKIHSHIKKGTSKNSIASNTIRDMVRDDDGRLWVGTFLGIDVFDSKGEKLIQIQPAMSNPHSLNHSSVYDLMIDAQKNLWVGTYFGGVNHTQLGNQLITFHTFETQGPGRMGPIIGHMLEDSHNNLWIATENKGLLFQASKANHYGHYSKKLEGLVKNVRAILLDEDEKIYIGTHYDGLNCLDIKSKKLLKFAGSETAPKVVNAIIRFKDNILLGCREGLFIFDTKNKSFSQSFGALGPESLINESVFSLYLDTQDRLWVGTESKGLIRYDLKTGKFRRFKASSNQKTLKTNAIYSLFEDSQGTIWIGTLGGGLSRYQPVSESFITYTQEEHNLPSNFIHGLEESKNGNLWIATSSGLSHMEVSKETFTNYSRGNGFPYAELNMGGLYLSNSGRLYIGSLGGLISVDEEEILEKPNSANIILSALYVNNKKEIPKDKASVLTTDIAVTNNIRLKPEHISFSIEFANCDYSGGFSHYRYRLDGLNEDWVYTRGDPVATYTNIRSGSYEFIVQSLDPVYNQPLAERTIKIEKLPPFYASTYAYLMYVILSIAMIAVLGKVWMTYTRLRLEQMDKENIRNLNQKKLQFFTNISHEFMTPLTLIIGSVEGLLGSSGLSLSAQKKINITYKSALRLKHLSTELLDFRKIEQGFMKFVYTEQELGKYLSNIVSSFADQASLKKIRLNTDFPNKPLNVWFDRNQMDKVFFNLISNAMKFVSNNDGLIKIAVLEKDDTIEVYVEDNGPGISLDAVERIFDRFYQSDELRGNNFEGSGLGLALSEGIVSAHGGSLKVTKTSPEGTVFSVEIKKGTAHLDTDDIDPDWQVDIDSGMSSVAMLSTIDDLSGLEPSENSRTEKHGLPKVLLVEDNKDVLSLLDELLHENYNIKLARNGEEGIKVAIDYQPSIIVSDIMMPKVDGTELCGKLKSNPLTSHIPVILLTAKSAIDHKVKGINLGADDYITKPFNANYLRARIANLLEKSRKLQEKFLASENTEDLVKLAQSSLDREFMEKVQGVVEQHIQNDKFDINQFSKEMGISRTLFFGKMKSITGQTPNDFLHVYRLKKSAETLTNNPTATVAEIAYSVGFTPKYYSRCFKAQFGMTPSAFRELRMG